MIRSLFTLLKVVFLILTEATPSLAKLLRGWMWPIASSGKYGMTMTVPSMTSGLSEPQLPNKRKSLSEQGTEGFLDLADRMELNLELLVVKALHVVSRQDDVGEA